MYTLQVLVAEQGGWKELIIIYKNKSVPLNTDQILIRLNKKENSYLHFSFENGNFLFPRISKNKMQCRKYFQCHFPKIILSCST